MFQIRKRWPLLAALVAAAVYGSNYYRIGGLEDLRIEPRAASPTTGDVRAVQAYASDGSWLAQSYVDELHPVGDRPGWNDMLSLGEKFAMWRDRRVATAAAGTPFEPGAANPPPSMPTSAPIPLPPGLDPAVTQAGSRFDNALHGRAGGASSASPSIPDSVLGADLAARGTGRANSLSPTRDVGFDGDAKAASKHGAQRVRVAGFNLHALGSAKLDKPQVLEMLVRILRQYEVVALQEIQSSRDDILPRLVEQLNQTGRRYDYLIGPRVGRGESRQQYAFVFDTSRVETDRYQLYSVEDPEDLITYDPLVAWFRCKGVPVDRAFTFSMVNLRVDPSRGAAERDLLPNLIQAIEEDGRREDDWMIVGDFAAGSSEMATLSRESVRLGLIDTPTDVAGERMRSGILFSARGTVEFTGRSGTFDFLRKYNLSLEQALQLSEHLPVWAEFSVLEGAQPGRIAPFDPDAVL